MRAWTINNNGTTNWQDGEIDSENSTFNNNGTFNIGNVTKYHTLSSGDASAINNFCLVTSTGGTAGNPVAIEAAFNNQDETDVESGEMDLEGGGSYSGLFDVAASASVVLANGLFTALPGARGAGDGAFIVGNGQAVAVLEVLQGAIVRQYNLTLANGGTISGPGDLFAYNQFNWTGGSMTGSGSTRSYGTATINSDAGEVQAGRMFVNRGTLNWLGSPGAPSWTQGANIAPFWTLDGATIENYGSFNIIAPAGRTAQMSNGQSWGSFENHGTINNTSAQDTQFAGISFNSADLENSGWGTLAVATGNVLFFGVTAGDGGTLQVAAGCSLILDGGTRFNLIAPDTMTGAGTLDCEDAEVTIVSGRVTATNFILNGGTLDGAGTFAATYFLWQAGNLESPDAAAAPAVCEVDAGGLFSIEGKNSDTNDGALGLGRQIKVFYGGRLEWGMDGVNEKDIEASGGASIVVYGTFDIGTNYEIINDDGSNCSLTIGPGGTMNIDANADNLGDETLRIGIPIVNDDGIVNASASVDAEGSGAGDGYTQTGGFAEINMSAGVYNFGPFFVSGGTANLSGGTVEAANTSDPETIGAGATFMGSGTITGGFSCGGELDLTGNLTSKGSSAIWGGTVHLYGSTLTIRESGLGGIFRDTGTLSNSGTIYLDNGTLTGNRIWNASSTETNLIGTITGSGTINCWTLSNVDGGQIVVGGQGTPGRITLNGNFAQDNSSSISIEIGGTLPLLQYDVFVINGSADLAGSLIVSLIGGYDPDPNNPLEVFTVIAYNSVTGDFSNWVGQGFAYDGNVGPTAVTITPISL